MFIDPLNYPLLQGGCSGSSSLAVAMMSPKFQQSFDLAPGQLPMNAFILTRRLEFDRQSPDNPCGVRWNRNAAKTEYSECPACVNLSAIRFGWNDNTKTPCKTSWTQLITDKCCWRWMAKEQKCTKIHRNNNIWCLINEILLKHATCEDFDFGAKVFQIPAYEFCKYFFSST